RIHINRKMASYKLWGLRFSSGAVACMLTIAIIQLLLGIANAVIGNVYTGCFVDGDEDQQVCVDLTGVAVNGYVLIAVAIFLLIMSAKAYANPCSTEHQPLLANPQYLQTSQAYQVYNTNPQPNMSAVPVSVCVSQEGTKQGQDSFPQYTIYN
ncbi:unnamed protein product, partial [Meganyctiphanes norvegica]